jgi:hypothetical protein
LAQGRGNRLFRGVGSEVTPPRKELLPALDRSAIPRRRVQLTCTVGIMKDRASPRLPTQ